MALNNTDSPSNFTAAGMHDATRRRVMVFEKPTPAVGVLPRQKMILPARILKVTGFQKTAGDTSGSTVVELLVDGTNILSTDVTLAQSGGDDLEAIGTLDTANDNYDENNMGIDVPKGAEIAPEITAVQTTVGAGLVIEVEYVLI